MELNGHCSQWPTVEPLFGTAVRGICTRTALHNCMDASSIHGCILSTDSKGYLSDTHRLIRQVSSAHCSISTFVAARLCTGSAFLYVISVPVSMDCTWPLLYLALRVFEIRSCTFLRLSFLGRVGLYDVFDLVKKPAAAFCF